MRRMALILAVVMFAVPAWAEITISTAQSPETNNLLIKYALHPEFANPPRAFALNISEPFDIYRELYVYRDFIQISGGQASNYGGPVVGSIPNNMTIENDLPYVSNGQVDMTSEGNEMELVDCPCWGDIANSVGIPPGDGTTVDLGDLTYLIGQLDIAGWTILIADRPDLACADVANGVGLPPGDGTTIDFGDLTYSIGTLSALGWSMNCWP